jgi:hypothetical protein
MSAILEVLQELIRCDRLRSSYPAGMSVRACQRHRLEMRVTRGEKGAVLSVDPKHPYCANECGLGAELDARARDAGAFMRSCTGCGAALIGQEALPACETCAAREAEENSKTKPARGFLPVRAEPLSERIWDGSAPDVPLGRAPGLPTPGEAAAAEIATRVRAAAPRVAPAAAAKDAQIIPENIPEDVGQDEPADPAEEDGMPRGKRGAPMECCGSTSTSKHRAGCKGLPKLPARPKAGRSRTRGVPIQIVVKKIPRPVGPIEEMEDAQLLDLRDRIDAELKERLDHVEGRRAALRQALGESAA